MAFSLIPYKCLVPATRRRLQMQMLPLNSVSQKFTFAVVSMDHPASNVLSVLDLDTDLFTAHIRWGDVHGVHASLVKLGSYLQDSKWTHWKIRVDPRVAWNIPPPSHYSCLPPPQQVLPFAWAFSYPMYRVIALVHQDPFPQMYMPFVKEVRCALKLDEQWQWQNTRLYIQPVYPPRRTFHTMDAKGNLKEYQNVSVTFYPPIVAWGSHINDDVRLCIDHWLGISKTKEDPAIMAMAMRHFSHILYSFAREPMYVRQYYTSNLLEIETSTSDSASTELQAFFLRKVYINLDTPFQHIVPSLYHDDWWAFRNAIQSMLFSFHHAARVIQRAWRLCISNPSYAICCKRLIRECHGEKIEAFTQMYRHAF